MSKATATKNQKAIGKPKASITPWIVFSILLIGLDQLAKWWVIQQIDLGAVVQITPFFNLVHVLNPGAAFSFLASETGWQKYFLSGVAVVASIVILFMMRSNRGKSFTLFCLASILAGAIGNLIDRNVYGAVVDFLDFYYQHYHWPAFNVADICISIGAIGLIIDELFLNKKGKDSK